jgi:hypothetical protein
VPFSRAPRGDKRSKPRAKAPERKTEAIARNSHTFEAIVKRFMVEYMARERTLSVEEIRRVWRAADKIGYPNFRLSL